MSNKIQGYGQPAMPATSGSTRTTSTEAVNRGDAKPVEAVTPGRDSVSVSDSAVLLQKLEEAVTNAPATDSGRVEQIKQALANGEYSVDAQRVADKILKFERDLAGRS
jgi:negative regulator of flagellin synthesis FlgM